MIDFSICFVTLGKEAFEKLTGLDYRGTTYRSVGNISLSECHSMCAKDETCKAAAFSFVVNPLAPVQETLCHLQNETDASNPTTTPQRAINMYYFVKLQVRSENVCSRQWTFERVPNKLLRGYDTAQLFTSSKEACLASCLNENRFVCRSLEYNHATLQCTLSEYDRRSPGAYVDFTDARGVDYFENLCNQGDEACLGSRNYIIPQFGVPADHVAHHVDLNYWTDKAVIATSPQACRRACELEGEFTCRSYLYKSTPSADNQYTCMLYHVDHMTFPEGPSTFHADMPMPLIDNGEKGGVYYELVCADRSVPAAVTSAPIQSAHDDSIGIATPTTVATTTPITTTIRTETRTNKPDANCDRLGVCYDVGVSCKDTRIVVRVKASRPFNGRVYALGRSETCNVDVRNRDNFYLDLTMNDQDCNTQSLGGIYTNTIVIQHHSVVVTKADKLYKIRCTYDISSKNVTFDTISVGDPQTINVTAAPEAPAPKILILAPSGREAEAVRIGDKLTFRIEIPPDTPYGIFARSCVAMAKDSRSIFEIIDSEGCPVDSGIFPQFIRNGNALESVYEAFRFTESYGVIFQCNVKYCLGPCEPINCSKNREGSIQSWGRKRRSNRGWEQYDGQSTSDRSASENTKDMTLSQEILVLDFDDPTPKSLTSPVEKLNNRLVPVVDSDVKFQDTIAIVESCPTRTSVLALGVTCGLLVLLYICTVFYVGVRRCVVTRKF
ncbi:hypothetical protein CHUAL_012231 [Chamberlinius hualienensis]